MNTKTARMKAWDHERETNRASLVTISINTRVPSKWRFTDLETGETWRWENNGFKLEVQKRKRV